MGGKHFVGNAIYISKTGHRQRIRFSNHSAPRPPPPAPRADSPAWCSCRESPPDHARTDDSSRGRRRRRGEEKDGTSEHESGTTHRFAAGGEEVDKTPSWRGSHAGLRRVGREEGRAGVASRRRKANAFSYTVLYTIECQGTFDVPVQQETGRAPSPPRPLDRTIHRLISPTIDPSVPTPAAEAAPVADDGLRFRRVETRP